MGMNEDFQLFLIKKGISELPQESQSQVEKAAAAIRETLSQFGDMGIVTLSLIGAELMTKEEK